MRNSYWGWIVAGVVCLIIIALSVTGIVNFNPTTNPPASSSVARNVESITELGVNLVHSVPLKMVA